MLGRAILWAWQREPPSPPPKPLIGISTMTTQQIRDLQAFAVELAREGRADAAREVLALIARG